MMKFLEYLLVREIWISVTTELIKTHITIKGIDDGEGDFEDIGLDILEFLQKKYTVINPFNIKYIYFGELCREIHDIQSTREYVIEVLADEDEDNVSQ